MVAAGTVLQGQDASIVYWDPRNPVAPLRKHNETHSDDVTSVRFSRMGSEEVLLSASTDGLLCTSNPAEDDEDEAGLSVGNWGCSIAKAGWLAGEGSTQAWARSDMETVSLWTGEVIVFCHVLFGAQNVLTCLQLPARHCTRFES